MTPPKQDTPEALDLVQKQLAELAKFMRVRGSFPPGYSAHSGMTWELVAQAAKSPPPLRRATPMSDESDMLTDRAAGFVRRFIRNDSDRERADECVVESVETTADEVELAFTLDRDRYYLRVRKNDLRRLLGATHAD